MARRLNRTHRRPLGHLQSKHVVHFNLMADLIAAAAAVRLSVLHVDTLDVIADIDYHSEMLYKQHCYNEYRRKNMLPPVNWI